MGRIFSVRFLRLGLLLAPLAPAAAQRPAARATCNGEMVSALEIHSYPAGSTFASDAWNVVRSFTGIHQVVTRPSVITAYLRVAVGKPCTELDRSESERLLRAQHFIASATVRPVADGPGRVRIVVETVDDIVTVVGGSLNGTSPASLLLGTENFDGRGLTVEGSVVRGFGYRDGFGGEVIQKGAFGRPYSVTVAAERDPLGDAMRVEFSRPFLTDLQPDGFHVGVTELNNYYDLTRPIGDDVFLNVRHVSYDLGLGTRVGPLSSGGLVGVLGALVMGEVINTASSGVFITDTGLVAAQLPEIDNRYAPQNVVRMGAFGGLRALKYETVRGFDAVTAAQDVGAGMQAALFGGPSIRAWNAPRDFFLSGEYYVGVGNPASFFQLRTLGEGRADRQAQRWDGIVGFGKAVWHGRPSDTETRVASLEFSEVQHLAIPVQLSFFDHIGGLPGFQRSDAVGGKRLIARVEERRQVKMISNRADWAVAAFADAGQIWAGDVPFGQRSDVHASYGVSLLAAYPAGGKRTYRLDFALPVRADGSRLEVRFNSSDQTRSIWLQPNDVTLAHSGTVLQNLGNWTPR